MRRVFYKLENGSNVASVFLTLHRPFGKMFPESNKAAEFAVLHGITRILMFDSSGACYAGVFLSPFFPRHSVTDLVFSSL